jgi:hypothetical protein
MMFKRLRAILWEIDFWIGTRFLRPIQSDNVRKVWKAIPTRLHHAMFEFSNKLLWTEAYLKINLGVLFVVEGAVHDAAIRVEHDPDHPNLHKFLKAVAE